MCYFEPAVAAIPLTRMSYLTYHRVDESAAEQAPGLAPRRDQDAAAFCRRAA